MSDNLDWYGEWVRYETEEEKADALIYLKLWMKFFVKKVELENVSETEIIIRENVELESMKNDHSGIFMSSAGIKFNATRKDESNERLRLHRLGCIFPIDSD